LLPLIGKGGGVLMLPLIGKGGGMLVLPLIVRGKNGPVLLGGRVDW